MFCDCGVPHADILEVVREKFGTDFYIPQLVDLGKDSLSEVYPLWKQSIAEWNAVLDDKEEQVIATSSSSTKLPSALDSRPTCDELHRQISVDVNRSVNYYDIHENLDECTRLAKREKLTQVLEQIGFGCDDSDDDRSTRHDESAGTLELRYLQGVHDIALVVMESAGDDVSVNELAEVIRDLLCQRFFLVHSNLNLSIALYLMLSQIAEVLRVHRPDTLHILLTQRHPMFKGHQHPKWRGDGTEFHFILPWIVTLFAHSISEFSKVVQIWNMILAMPPPFVLYWMAVCVARKVDGIEEIDCETIFLQAISWLHKLSPLELNLRMCTEMSLRVKFNELYVDAREASRPLLSPLSVCPPLWSPVLLPHSLIRRDGGVSFSVPIDVLSDWVARVRALSDELAALKQPTTTRRRFLFVFKK